MKQLRRNRRIRVLTLGLLLTYLFCIPNSVLAQRCVELDLAEIYSGGKLARVNRNLSVGQESANKFLQIELKLAKGQVPGRDERGIVWLPVEDFTEGTIELHARGRDIAQGSFIGVAFHALNDSTYDNVYARPFNFIVTDSLSRIHAVQYTYAPRYEWQKLRAEQNGKYEKGIENAPRPNEWFTMTIEVSRDSVKTYFNYASKPSLVVKKLNENTRGKVGLTGINYDIDRMKIYYK